MNLLCAICSDLFVPSDHVYSTPCGHIFHYVCLLQWLEGSETCPQCRNRCIESKLVKVYFNVAANASGEDGAQLLVKMDNLTLKLQEAEKNMKDQQQEHEDEKKKMQRKLLGLEEEIRCKESKMLEILDEVGREAFLEVAAMFKRELQGQHTIIRQQQSDRLRIENELTHEIRKRKALKESLKDLLE